MKAIGPWPFEGQPVLFQMELEDLAQAFGALMNRGSLEERLLLERRDVENVGEKIH